MSIKQNKPDKIILHCSATPDEGDSIGAEEINEWHKKRGWEDPASGVHCGYHYVIRRSGVIESDYSGNPCRPTTSIGAHCRGYNTNSLGICIVGTRLMTPQQLESWLKLYQRINNVHQIPIDKVYGHNQFSNKDCPGFDMHIIRLFMKRGLKYGWL
jgi:hypothetical protein